jgi:adenosylcobinamide amidohydrolase
MRWAARSICPPFVVTALVTAGAGTNALRPGWTKGEHIEGKTGDKEPHGTVNVILLSNAKLTDGAMARAIITLTEAKTAAFEDLGVTSSYTESVQATGTGTDGAIVVSGVNGPKVTYTGGHSKIGELIGKAVHEGVMEALQKQNGFKQIKKLHLNRPLHAYMRRLHLQLTSQLILWGSLTAPGAPDRPWFCRHLAAG